MASKEAVNGPVFYKKTLRFLSKKRTRTYIVPTAFGVAFSSMALVLFFLAVGYSNNLIYLFVFFLISMAFTGLLLTNKNVDGIDLEKIVAEDLFANERGQITLLFKNYFSAEAREFEIFLQKKELSLIEVIAPLEEKGGMVFWTPPRRGVVALPRPQLQSRFPFGLLRAWKVFKKPHSVIVYPERKGTVQFPGLADQSERSQAVGLFRDHRTFQSSDSMRRIDWRASSRKQELLVKNFEDMEKPSLDFSWTQTAHLPEIEDRLSQLSLWIDEAEKQGYKYSLSFSTKKLPTDHGHHHRKKCLEFLATVPIEDLR